VSPAPRAARPALAGALAALLLHPAVPAGAAPPAPAVAFLCPSACSSLPSLNLVRDRAFLDVLEQAGVAAGRRVSIDTSGVAVGYGRLDAAAARLAARKVAVIIAVGNEAVIAARAATTRTPIVMLNVADALEEGLVASLARPGGNVTGLSVPLGQLAAKHVELLREINPRLARVSVLWTADTGPHRRRLARLERAVRPLGVTISPVGVTRFGDLEKSIGAAGLGASGGLLLFEQMLGTARRDIALIGLKHRVATVAADRFLAEAGGLMSYGPDVTDLFRRAAVYAGRLLEGARPGELPIEEPTRFELVVNQGTARALGLTIPSSILLRADEVLQ
jgi:putative ABC transport system substrate-binding protein